MRGVSGRLAQSAFCDPFSSVIPRCFLTRLKRPNSRSPSNRLASIVSKNPAGDKSAGLAKESQIVVCPVQDELMLFERGPKRRQVGLRQRVHQFVPPGGADLDQAEFFRIRVQAVGFGVHGDPLGALKRRQEFSQLGIRIDHGSTLRQKSRWKSEKRPPAVSVGRKIHSPPRVACANQSPGLIR